jgi:uncharacterized protein (DUF58 family)
LDRVARSPEAILRRVEMRVARRLDGVLQGERRGRRPGPGGDPSITRAYAPGDDVRWIDWPLTARSGEAMVRVPELEPVLTAWALVDISPSMQFGSRVRTKADLGREALAGFGTVLRRRGDRLGIAATTTEKLDLIRPPRGDRRGLVSALAALDRLPPTPTGARTDLAGAITRLGRVARHRGAIAVISDFPYQQGLESALGALARRHEVIAIELRDVRERELPESLGTIRLRDMETGATQVVDTADPRFRERLAQVAAEADAARAAMFVRVGARRVVLDTDRDWVLDLARALSRGVNRRAAI